MARDVGPRCFIAPICYFSRSIICGQFCAGALGCVVRATRVGADLLSLAGMILVYLSEDPIPVRGTTQKQQWLTSWRYVEILSDHIVCGALFHCSGDGDTVALRRRKGIASMEVTMAESNFGIH